LVFLMRASRTRRRGIAAKLGGQQLVVKAAVTRAAVLERSRPDKLQATPKLRKADEMWSDMTVRWWAERFPP